MSKSAVLLSSVGFLFLLGSVACINNTMSKEKENTVAVALAPAASDAPDARFIGFGGLGLGGLGFGGMGLGGLGFGGLGLGGLGFGGLGFGGLGGLGFGRIGMFFDEDTEDTPDQLPMKGADRTAMNDENDEDMSAYREMGLDGAYRRRGGMERGNKPGWGQKDGMRRHMNWDRRRVRTDERRRDGEEMINVVLKPLRRSDENMNRGYRSEEKRNRDSEKL